MYRSGGIALGFSLKPPAWLRQTVASIFQKGTEGGVSVPLPGGGTAQVIQPRPPDPFTVTPQLAGGAGLAIAALAAMFLLGRSRARR